jgi:hypothetical protein
MRVSELEQPKKGDRRKNVAARVRKRLECTVVAISSDEEAVKAPE